VVNRVNKITVGIGISLVVVIGWDGTSRRRVSRVISRVPDV